MAQRFRGEQREDPAFGYWNRDEIREDRRREMRERDPQGDAEQASRLSRRYGAQEPPGTEEAGQFGPYRGRGESGAGFGYGREYAAGDWPQSAEDTTGRAYSRMGGSAWQGGGESYYRDDVNSALVDRDRDWQPPPFSGEAENRYGGGMPYHGPNFRGRGPKGYQRSDERLKEVICERLTEAPDIDASDITIRCKDGIVILEGSIADRRMKHRVEDLVDDCYGVKDIENHIRVAANRPGQEQPGAGAQLSGPQPGGVPLGGGPLSGGQPGKGGVGR